MRIADAFVDELTIEAATTKRVLQRVPEARFGWQPHQKSISLGQLALQVATLPGLVTQFLSGECFRKGAFPKAKTNKAMNPTAGPARAAEGRARLEAAHRQFDEACRQLTSQGTRMRPTIFGAVPVEDYVRFMELHTRHHGKQMATRP